MAVKAGERNVPDTPQNRQLDAAWYARELAVYTLKICANKNVFLQEHESAVTEKIRELAIGIYMDVQDANNIRVEGRQREQLWAEREKLQRRAIRKCKKLMAMIGLARGLFHLKGKRVNYWSEQVKTARDYIAKWWQGDCKRYS